MTRLSHVLDLKTKRRQRKKTCTNQIQQETKVAFVQKHENIPKTGKKYCTNSHINRIVVVVVGDFCCSFEFFEGCTSLQNEVHFLKPVKKKRQLKCFNLFCFYFREIKKGERKINTK